MDACGKRGNLTLAAPGGAGEVVSAWRLCSACAGDYEDPDRTAFLLPEEEEVRHNPSHDVDRPACGDRPVDPQQDVG